ncbi:MAG: hypothetical protein AB1472_05730 [Candidatus Omnitrophota bacterium]
MFYKEIVCLANSRRLQGRCVAGRDIKTNEWIRPVSSGETLTIDQIRLKDRSIPDLLDIIRIPCKERAPIFCQPENILIEAGTWEKLGRYDKKIENLCDHPKLLWWNDKPSQDRVDEEFLKKNKVDQSLFFIRPDSIIIRRHLRAEYGIKTRAVFSYNSVEYDFGVTDIDIEDEYKEKACGDYKLNTRQIYLCISLAGAFKGNCYKLVAGVVRV